MHPYALSACREWCDVWRKPLKLQRKIRQRGGKCVSQEKKGQLKDLLQWSSRLHEPRGWSWTSKDSTAERWLNADCFIIFICRSKSSKDEAVTEAWFGQSCWSMLRLLLLELLAVVFWAVAPFAFIPVALWESLTPWHVDVHVRKQLLWLLTTSSLIASSGVQRIFRDAKQKHVAHIYTCKATLSCANLLFIVDDGLLQKIQTKPSTVRNNVFYESHNARFDWIYLDKIGVQDQEPFGSVAGALQPQNQPFEVMQRDSCTILRING